MGYSSEERVTSPALNLGRHDLACDVFIKKYFAAGLV